MSSDEPLGHGNVFTLQGTPVGTEPSKLVVHEDIVAELRSQLKDAEEGRLVAFASVLVYAPDAGITTVSFGNRLQLLAGAARLVHRFNQICDEHIEVPKD